MRRMLRWLTLLLTGCTMPALAAAQTPQDVQATSTRVTRVSVGTKTTVYGSDSIVVIREDRAVTRFLIRPKAGRTLPQLTCTSTRSSRVAAAAGAAIQGDSILFWRLDQDSVRALCKLSGPPTPPPPPPPPAGPTLAFSVSCGPLQGGRSTCTFDASSSVGATAVRWRNEGGSLIQAVATWTDDYSAPRRRHFNLAVENAAGVVDSVGYLWVVPDTGLVAVIRGPDTTWVDAPVPPPPGPAAVDPMLWGVRITTAAGRPIPPVGSLDSLRIGDSMLVCTQSYLLADPSVVGVASPDRPVCAGAAHGSRPLSGAEQAAVDTMCLKPSIAMQPTNGSVGVRTTAGGRCAVWLVGLP